MDIMGMMGKAKQLQAKLEALQAEMDTIEVDGESGGGLVKCRATAKGEMRVAVDRSQRDQAGGEGNPRRPDHGRPRRRPEEGRGGDGREGVGAGRRPAAAARAEAVLRCSAAHAVPAGRRSPCDPGPFAGRRLFFGRSRLGASRRLGRRGFVEERCGIPDARCRRSRDRTPGPAAGPPARARAALGAARRAAPHQEARAADGAARHRLGRRLDQGHGVPDLRQHRHHRSLQRVRRPAPRPGDAGGGRRRRRSVGAGAGGGDPGALPRAGRHAVAARRRRSRTTSISAGWSSASARARCAR